MISLPSAADQVRWIRSDDTHRDDGVRHLGESGDVGTHDVVAWVAIGVSGLDAAIMDVSHDLLQAGLCGVEVPGVARGILLHLQGRGGHATSVGGLAGSEEDTGIMEGVHSLGGTWHVGTFGHGNHTIPDERGGRLAIELVLGRARQGDVSRGVPDRAVGVEGGRVAASGVLADACPLDLLDLLEQGDVCLLYTSTLPTTLSTCRSRWSPDH